MSLCRTLLAAYACMMASNTQVPLGTPTINATMIGAAGAQYSLAIPVDFSIVYTNTNLGISHIETDGGSCTFCGIDGVDVKTMTGPATYSLVDVGPPQTITFAVCT